MQQETLELCDISDMSKNIKILFLSAQKNRNYTKVQEEVTAAFLKENGFENIDRILVPGASEIP
jgi:6,7-dimethyl-8-ribityllumazine synthase